MKAANQKCANGYYTDDFAFAQPFPYSYRKHYDANYAQESRQYKQYEIPILADIKIHF